MLEYFSDTLSPAVSFNPIAGLLNVELIVTLRGRGMGRERKFQTEDILL